MAFTRPAGTWSYADLAGLPDDGRRYEIIDGELYEMPAPMFAHAAATMALIDLLLPLVKGLVGRLLTAPLDIFFAGTAPVQPDLVVMQAGSRVRPVFCGVEGLPDLLIEVLSPSNRAMTRCASARSMRAGVREFWIIIIDPEAATIEFIGEDGETVQRVAAASGALRCSRRSSAISHPTPPPSFRPARSIEVRGR
jgi:Uma2 family endonuclease